MEKKQEIKKSVENEFFGKKFFISHGCPKICRKSEKISEKFQGIFVNRRNISILVKIFFRISRKFSRFLNFTRNS